MNSFKLGTLGLVLCCAACSNAEVPNTGKTTDPQAERRVQSQLEKIEDAFARGDSKTACKLQMSMSKDPSSLKKISPGLLQELNTLQIKCGSKLFSIDLGQQ